MLGRASLATFATEFRQVFPNHFFLVHNLAGKYYITPSQVHNLAWGSIRNALDRKAHLVQTTTKGCTRAVWWLSGVGRMRRSPTLTKPFPKLGNDLFCWRSGLKQPVIRHPHAPSTSITPVAQEPLRLLFSQRESCRILGISLRTLQNLIASKQISVRRIGRRVLVARRDLEAFARCDHPRTGGQ